MTARISVCILRTRCASFFARARVTASIRVSGNLCAFKTQRISKSFWRDKKHTKELTKIMLKKNNQSESRARPTTSKWRKGSQHKGRIYVHEESQYQNNHHTHKKKKSHKPRLRIAFTCMNNQYTYRFFSGVQKAAILRGVLREVFFFGVFPIYIYIYIHICDRGKTRPARARARARSTIVRFAANDDDHKTRSQTT